MKLSRALAIARTEVMHILRDPFTAGMALGLPIILVVYFGFAIDFDFRNVKLALYDFDNTRQSRQLADVFLASGYFKLDKGAYPGGMLKEVEAEKETAQETVFELQKGRIEEKPWEKAMQKRNHAEREAYQAEAAKLRAAAARQSQQDRAMLLQAAADLERFSETMPKPKTLRQTILEFLGVSAPSKLQDRKPPAKGENGIER